MALRILKRGRQNKRGVGTKYKREKAKIGLSLLLRSASVFLVYCGATYSNEITKVYDIFMNFFVVPREI